MVGNAALAVQPTAPDDTSDPEAELRHVVDLLAASEAENERLRGELQAANDAYWSLVRNRSSIWD
jgi:hypothetical protein